jgi:hypothetical protein
MRQALAVFLALVSLGLGACGGDEESASTEPLPLDCPRAYVPIDVGSLLVHRDLSIDQIRQGQVRLVIAGNADIKEGEAHLVWRIVCGGPVISNSRDCRHPERIQWMRDEPRHPSIVANNHQAINLDVDGECRHTPTEECVFPLARSCAIRILDSRQREIRIRSRWWDNVCAADAYSVNYPAGGRCRAYGEQRSSDERDN